MTSHPHRESARVTDAAWRVLTFVGAALALISAVMGAASIVPWLYGGVSAGLPLTALVLIGVGVAVIAIAVIGGARRRGANER